MKGEQLRRASRRRAREEEDDEGGSMLLVPVWIGLFLGAWWGIDRLFLLAARALRGAGLAEQGAAALAGSREVVAPVLGLLLGTYAIALLGSLRRWARGEPPACEVVQEPARPDPVAARLREVAAVARVEGELARARRADRGAVRRAVHSVNDRLMVGALRRRGYNDDIGCGGIVLILVAAAIALPFAAEATSRLIGVSLAGPLGALLWFALAYGGFLLRWLWKRGRDGAARTR